jgi:hypothetical protein
LQNAIAQNQSVEQRRGGVDTDQRQKTAAERTRHIKLGTGVISVSYHNPL